MRDQQVADAVVAEANRRRVSLSVSQTNFGGFTLAGRGRVATLKMNGDDVVVVIKIPGQQFPATIRFTNVSVMMMRFVVLEMLGIPTP